MRLTFDDEIFTRQRRGGVSRYFVELMREFRRDPALGVQLVQPAWWTVNEHLLDAGLGRRLPTRLGASRRALTLANKAMSAPRRAEVLHHTFYSRSSLRTHAPAVRAVTVYDMIPELHPELFATGNPHFDKQEFVHRADVIFCISESTRRDLLAVYGSQSAPVVVTPLGVGREFAADAPRAAGLPERYVLHVGARGQYKDFRVLAEAFAQLPVDSPAQHLIAVGGEPVSQEEASQWRAWGIADRVRRVDAADGQMPGIYANALCFVYPSRYEGFGLPTLEAMATGCPTVLANSSSHPEVGGEAALYFPPGDYVALAKILGELCGDASLRRAKAEHGIGQAASFTWEVTARLTAAGYRVGLG